MNHAPLVIIAIAVSLVMSGCGKSDVLNTSSSVGAASAKATASPKPTPAPFHITDVHVDRDRFDPTKGESVAVQYAIDEAAEVTLHIYDGRDALIYRGETEKVAAGEHKLSWDGTDASGEAVPPEAYSYVLVATSDKGTVTHDLTDLTGSEALIVADPQWDAATGKLRYRLDRPARVNVRFGLMDGPYMRTVIDWVPRGAGDQVEAWDGWDTSKVLSLAKHPMLSPTVRAYTLPNNTIFVGQNPNDVRFVAMPALASRARQKKPEKTRMYFHADQPLETRGDIPVNLSIFGDGERDAEGRWVVSGVVPIRLDVPREVRARVLERRFEPAFYTDGIFVFETEVGVLPITWQWDSTVVNPGEHYITANIRGYEGNYGAATLKVWVKPAAGPKAAPASTITPKVAP